MKTLLFAATAVAVLTGANPAPSMADATKPVSQVIQWNRTLLLIVRTPAVQPATVHPTRSFAIMHAAIYDAVNAIDGTHKPYLVRLSASHFASQEAAAAAAAHEVLVKLYPSFQVALDTQFQQALAQLPNGGKADGVSIGNTVADRILGLRANDGSNAQPIPYVFGNVPGDYQSTPPIVQSGVNAFLAAEQALQEMPFTRNWGKTTVTLEPVGVAGLITAWNANALFICLKLASAVAAGCTVVVKPSELSALQTQVLIEALQEARLPRGVLNVVTGKGDVVGAELVRNPHVDKISFTGSVAVGETIMRDGATTMKRLTLELGGKSPTILLDDANLAEAIPAALVMAFLNSGQACAAGTRLLVPRTRLETVKQAIADAMPAFPVGHPADPNTAVGPMVSQKQYERVQSYIRKGIDEGAMVLVGGEGRPEGFEAGYFVKPTVFVDVTNDMTIALEEIFGPVLGVITYDTEEDAIAIANDSRYGLHAAVLGTDLARARRVAAQLRAGRVVINGMTDDPKAPWGGFKYSGVGREYGQYGIEAFLEPRAILEV